MPTSRRPSSTSLVVAGFLTLVLAGCQGPPSVSPTGTPAPAASSTPTTLPEFDTTSTVGGYAAGFPVALLAGPDGTTVLASSATPRDGLVDVSLNLSTELGPRKIVRQYSRALKAAGFERSEGARSPALAEQATFTRTTEGGDPVVESVHLGVLDEGERRLVTVFGTVAPVDG